MLPLTARLATGQWAGRRAFVVGSGPSLKGFDFSLLGGELTVGTNEEYRWGPTISICQDVRFFFGDGSRVAAKDNPAWYKNPLGSIPVFFKGHPDRPDPVVHNDFISYAHAAHSVDAPFRWGKTLEEGLCYGANCGLAALNLADVLGADPIYLLGFDCRADGGETHHHSHYPPEWSSQNPAVYDIWMRDFWKQAPHVRAKVFNLNPESALGCFQKLEGLCLPTTHIGFQDGRNYINRRGAEVHS